MDSCPNLSLNLNLEPSPEQSETLKEGEMMEVISKIYSDNRKIRRMVDEIFQSYSSLHAKMMQNTNDDRQIKKRKFDHLECSSCCNEERLKMMKNLKPEVSTVFIRVDPIDSSLAVKDGYEWRKYGQKVTRDNPSPRAYFKCSFAPLCPVKKKVQKSVEDPRVLVVTYQGKHNHKKPSSHGSILTSSNIISNTCSLINLIPSSHEISSQDHLSCRNHSDDEPKEKCSKEERDEQDWVLERMASSLTKDPSFTSILATIISDKVLQHTFY